MASSLPPEILDLIVDHLHDDPAALGACCLVSKLWVWRTRSHLFARIEFHSDASPVALWMKAFPVPSNSPAHHTHILKVHDPEIVSSTTPARPWIRSFTQIVELQVDPTSWGFPNPLFGVSLVHLHGLSPTLKYLHISHCSIPLPEVFNLVCSFPLLEDLDLYFPLTGVESGTDEWSIPSTSPKLTGSLSLDECAPPLIHGLLDFPGGLHFSRVSVGCLADQIQLTADLVSGCISTLESLRIVYYAPSDRPLVPSLLDLSEANKLRDVEIHWNSLEIRWLTTTLQTIQPSIIRHITLVLYSVRSLPYTLSELTEEIVQEWQGLDRLLARWWSLHSVIPRMVYGRALAGLESTLTPELENSAAVMVARDR